MDEMQFLSDEIKRFVLRSIDTVPHLEAVLIFYRDPHVDWDAKAIAQALYINEKRSSEILADLCDSGFISKMQSDGVTLYKFFPNSLELERIIAKLDRIYAANLIEITDLIHAKMDKQAKDFGDAFKWRKEKE